MELAIEHLRRVDVKLSVNCRIGDPFILFLHGLAGYGAEWLGVAEYLGESVGLLIPDQRGHGASWGPSGVDVGREDYVGDAVALIETLAGSHPVVVVGQSMGGIVGTYLASDRPDLVASLVLIETGMEAMSADQIRDLKDWLDAWSSGFESVAEAHEFFGVGKPSTQVWVDGLEWRNGRLMGRFDPSQMVELMRNLASESRWTDWANITADRTVVTASSTMLDQSDIARMLEAAPVTEHITVSDSGHDVHLDQPRAVAEVITRAAQRTRTSRP